jgi:tetratricopeptide (TPR) repeat protein
MSKAARMTILILMAAGMTGLSWAEEAAAPAAQASNQSLNQMLAEANQDYDQRGQEGMLAKAVTLYQAIRKDDPQNYEAGWRLSRALFRLANKTKDDQQALRYLAEGENIGKNLSETYPQGRDGLYWYGVCMGRAAERRGIMNSLFAVGPMHDIMEKILKLNPHDAFAHHFLGILYRKAPGWPLSLGDKNKSLEEAQAAAMSEPGSTVILLDLGRTYLDLGKKEEAKKLFQQILEMPGLPDMQPETAEDKEDAKALLENLK